MLRHICALAVILWTSLAAHADDIKPTPTPMPTCVGEPCVMSKFFGAPTNPSPDALKAAGMIVSNKAISNTHVNTRFEFKF